MDSDLLKVGTEGSLDMRLDRKQVCPHVFILMSKGKLVTVRMKLVEARTAERDP